MTVSIDKFGRILIPKDVRDRLGIEPGTEFSLDVCEGGDEAPSIELRPCREEAPLVWKGSVLVHTGKSTKEVDTNELIRSSREERDRRLGGLE